LLKPWFRVGSTPGLLLLQRPCEWRTPKFGCSAVPPDSVHSPTVTHRYRNKNKVRCGAGGHRRRALPNRCTPSAIGTATRAAGARIRGGAGERRGGDAARRALPSLYTPSAICGGSLRNKNKQRYGKGLHTEGGAAAVALRRPPGHGRCRDISVVPSPSVARQARGTTPSPSIVCQARGPDRARREAHGVPLCSAVHCWLGCRWSWCP